MIDCTFIGKVEDLHHPDHIPFFESSAGHGMIEIKIEDSGTGIREEDKDKLFKLFGFLDATKDLNTKGVGLGLHISQRICEQFGGKILLESEFEIGSTFTCLFDLKKKTEGQSKIKRHLNPVKKNYQKLVVKKQI